MVREDLREEVRDQQGLASGWSATKFYSDDFCQPGIRIKGLGLGTRSLFTFSFRLPLAPVLSPQACIVVVN